MPKITVSGRILHSGLDITINNLPPVEWPDDQLGLTMKFQTTIQANAITIECTANKFIFSEHMSAIYTRAYDISRASVDLVGFMRGLGLIVVLDTFTPPDGMPERLVAHDPSLAQLNTAVNLEDFGKSLEAILSEPAAFFGLRDLMESITIPNRQAVNCARVIDALRVALEPSDAKKKKGWAELQRALNLGESYLKRITKAAEGHRHGDWHFIDPETTGDVVKRTWVVMDRYIEYRKRGRRQLPLSDFPLLV